LLRFYGEELVKRHTQQLDNLYFQQMSLSEIERHLQVIEVLDASNPCQVFVDADADHWNIHMVARDFPGLFPLFSGVVTLFGFNISSAVVFTYRSALENVPEKGAVAIDRLTVNVAPEVVNAEKDHNYWQNKINQELLQYVQLSLKEGVQQARTLLHQRIGDFLSRGTFNESLRLLPLKFTAEQEADYSCIRFSAQDTPAFLFSFTNALSMDGCLIHEIDTYTDQTLAHSVIRITDRQGRRLSEDHLSRLEAVVALTKQFTAYLPHASDYDLAIRQFYQFMERFLDNPDNRYDILSDQEGEWMPVMARMFGSGSYLWEEFTKTHYQSLLPLLSNREELRNFRSSGELGARLRGELAGAETFEEKIDVINHFKDQELFRVDLAHQAFPGYSFIDFSRQIGVLAEVVLELTMQLCYWHLAERLGEPGGEGLLEGNRWALLGLGKFGGQELGYASDLELALVYDVSGEASNGLSASEFYEKLMKLFRKSVRAKREGIFEMDLRLRPHGESGPLCSSLQAWKSYYSGEAVADYERQALVKLRGVGGDLSLCWEIERERDAIVYNDSPVDTNAFFELRRKQMDHLVNTKKQNAKFSGGGLVDVEYSVQLLQREHGFKAPELRTTNTQKALRALLEREIITPSEYEKLYNAYAWFRRMINSLRIVRGNAKDLEIPATDTLEFDFLARRMGLVARGNQSAAERLQSEIHLHFSNVNYFVQKRFREERNAPSFLPGLPEALKGDLSQEESEKLLQKSGFTDSSRALRLINATMERSKNKAMFVSVFVLSAPALQKSPDPDRALVHFLSFLENLEQKENLLERLFFHPEYLDMISVVLGGSEFLTIEITKSPHWIMELLSSGELYRHLGADYYSQSLQEKLTDLQNSFQSRMDAIRRFRNRHLLRIALRDLHLGVELSEVTRDISNLSDAVIEQVLEEVFREQNCLHLRESQSVIAMGKLGGSELNYSSDIDLTFVHYLDAAQSDQIQQLEKVYRLMVRELTAHTAWGQLFRVDLNLRPWGGQGSMVSGLQAYEKYYQDVADGWELQAWLKARTVCGEMEKGQTLISYVQYLSFTPPWKEKVEPSMLHMRQKVLELLEQKEIEHREVKSGKGGIRTIEFFVQRLQLRHADRYRVLRTGNTLQALEALEKLDFIETDVADQMREYYIFLRRLEHCLQLFGMQQLHLFPSEPEEIQKLARRMGYVDQVGRAAGEQLKNRLSKVWQDLCEYSLA